MSFKKISIKKIKKIKKEVKPGPHTAAVHIALEQMYGQRLGFFPPKTLGSQLPRQACSGNIYKKNAGIAFLSFFFLRNLKMFKRHSRGRAWLF